MNLADNLARVFVVIIFLTFRQIQMLRGISHNQIAFGLFQGEFGCFALTRKIAEVLRDKRKV